MKLNEDNRLQVNEATLDIAKNMDAAVIQIFKNTTLNTDRFHVIKLAVEALQHTIIKLRWYELDKENKALKKATEQQIKYEPLVVENGETPKQLLARYKYALAKKK